MTTTREDLDKRYPPRPRQYQGAQRGLDATEFVARYGEIKARVDVPKDQGESKCTDQ